MTESDGQATPRMEIEVWSDVVCPWCYVGKRRLEQALVGHGRSVHVIHRAFQLDPSARSEGRLTVEVLAGKYQVGLEQSLAMMANVTQAAKESGLEYRLEGTVSGNTMNAHRLLLWAQRQGRAQDLLESLYAGYFTQQRPIFTTQELMPFVVQAGMEAAEAEAMLSTDAYADQVRHDQELAASLGATGVPFFVIDRRYGISGAQPLEVFQQTLAAAAEGS